MATTIAMTAKFPGTCSACGLKFSAGAPILWSKLTRKASHASDAACFDAQIKLAEVLSTQAPPPPPVTANGSSIAAFLNAAKEKGLKFPKVRFLAPNGGELLLSVAGPKAKVPGSIQVLVGGEWMGRIEPSGAVVGKQLSSNMVLLSALSTIAQDPAAAAKAYGSVTCKCSFCNKNLTDEGSVEVGYGGTCAAKYGLPHKPKGTKAVSAVS